MQTKEPATLVDLRLFDEATRSLLGYFVHTWYRHYLAIITENFRRYFDLGLIKGLAEPSEIGRYTMLFDFTALDLEKLCYINGIYCYVLSGKGANYRLMNRFDGKQVLYLRGYDFEGSVTTGGYVVRDATDQALACAYAWEPKADADTAKMLTMDEARRVASKIAKLPTLLPRN